LLAEKFQARVLASYPQRLGFWRVELCVDPVAHDGSAAGITLALNRWLESYLGGSDDACASWLWAHDRCGTRIFLPAVSVSRPNAICCLLTFARADSLGCRAKPGCGSACRTGWATW